MKMNPCPFCGNGEELEYINLSCGECDEGSAVLCHVCGANGPVVYVDYSSVSEYTVDCWQQRKEAIKLVNEKYRQLSIEKWNNRKENNA